MNGPKKLTDTEIAAEIESLRRKARPALVTGGVMLGTCAAAALVFVILRDTGGIDSVPGWAVIILSGIGLIGVIFVFVGSVYKRRLKKVVGNHLVRGILEEFFELDTYDVNTHISEDVIRSANMIRGWKNARGSDYVSGRYKTVGIQFSDIELYYVENNKGKDGKDHEREVTVFKGPWMICDFHRPLPARLLVRENSRKLFTGKYQKDGNDLDTESEAFNARYEIRTEDPHTAFYILTPHFMEKLQEINDRARGRFFICFEEHRIQIAIDNRHDSFEVGSKAAEFKHLDALRNRFRWEIRYLTDIIDELMQNETLFNRNA